MVIFQGLFEHTFSIRKLVTLYSIIISWLLTLVKNEVDGTPFSVSGLQMITKNNLPYMFVIINPTGDDHQHLQKAKKRKNFSEFNEFVTRVKRFMANTKLCDVTPWAWREGRIDQLLSETDVDRCDRDGFSNMCFFTERPK